ncbi:hypothetical protein SNE40_000103 [Patella caerulea]|uniref:Protocadherin Fat 4 n=1 Tax=Patella caerulea TaxID=87958 RepID=A0AAN8K9U5_PATCE
MKNIILCFGLISVLYLTKAAPPTCTPAISVNITATEPIDTLIADLNCSDPDPGDTITLSFQSGNTDTQFKISGGNILLAKTFTAQVTYQYVMVILATDTNSETATVSLTVQVVNVNNNPPVISGLPSPIPVRESDPIGTLIATCTHTDQDPGNTLAGQTRVGISKPFGAAARKWVLDSQSCELYINTLLDYETTKEYKVDILAWDLDPHNPRTTTQQITINVLDVNDNQPSCTEYLLVAPTLSTTAIGAPITTINCTDPDVGNSGLVSFQLDASNSATVTNLFEVDNTGKLTLKSGITGPTPFYEVLIRVQDGGSPSLFTRVLIRVVVTDVPQDGPQPNSAFTGVLPPPSPELPTPLDTRNKPALTPTGAANIPVCALYGLTIVIPETTSVGETLYDLRCTDPDGDTLSYSIDKGDGYNKFDVSTGSLKVIKEFNSDFTFKFSLYITVTDDSPSKLSTMIIIGLFVTNSNDNTPVIKNLPSIIEVSEAKPFGAVINKCIINDKDNKHGELPGQTRVGLANPNDAVTKNFLVDSVTCNLYVNTELDFETTTSYVLTLLAWDLDQTAPKTATSTFTVMVTDANDNAPICPATLSTTLAEDAAINTVVQTVTCIDVDTGDNKKVYFKMDESNTALVKASFDVSGTTGVVTLQASLDYETQTSHEVKIIAYDGGSPSLSFTSTIQVTVMDVNDGTATQTYSAPTYTAKPDVMVSLEQLGPGGAGSYKFTCDFPLDTNPLHYLVKWFIDGYPVYSTPRILNTADVQDLTKLTEAKLAEIGVTTVGFTIKCEFRASFEINSFLGDNSTSDEKFIGIKVLTKTINIKQGEEGIIQIQATAPIGCQTNGCSYPLYTYIEQNGFGCSLKTSPTESCGVSIPAASYSDVYEVKVKGGITYQYGRGISTSTLKLRAPEVFADHPMWSNYVLDDVTVNIEQNTALIEGSKCAAFVDPRIVTFDRGLLDLQVMGTYTLYKRGEQEIQITTYQCDTERNAWCVCGVAIRAGRDVYLMNKCGLEFHDLRYSLCEETSSDVLKVEKFETLYQVYLPTGTRVKVFIRPDNMNVFIYPSVMDIGVSRGLCGNLSGISKDDLILKNGAQSTETVSRARFEPAPIFFNSWKVSTGDSLFVEANYPSLTGYTGGAFAYNADSYQCQPLINPLTGGTGPISSTACNLFSNVNRVVRDELYIPVEKKNCGSGGSRRKRSAPSYTGEKDVEVTTLSRSKRNVEWKNGWTLESTEKFCNELFNTSSMVSLCKDLSLVDVYSAKVACVMDIQLTGNNTFSLAAMSSIRSQCIHELNSNETFFVPSIPGQPPIYDLISAVTCPGECTQQGSCIDGICECVDGFGGVDCSVDIRTKPLLVKLHNDGLCDLKIDNCTEVTAFGETFVQTPKTSCKATYFEQKETGEMEISVGVATKPYLESISEAVCQVPERPAQSKPNSYEFVTGYMISFTNDGSTYSKPNYMAIYHSDCQQCDVTSDGVNCTFKTPSCISGGQCYSDGADYEHNSCYTCSANTTHRAWVLKDLDECEDEEEEESMLWVIGAVAGVLISVALMAVIIYLIKRKNKISASRTLLDPEGKLAGNGNYKKSDAFEHKTAI